MPKSGPKTDHIAWSDLRVALHLGREGSVRGAARALGVSHSTILRRIHTLEQAAGTELFVDRGQGYETTDAGQEVVDLALELEDRVIALERRVAGHDLRPAGPVSVTIPDPFAPILVPVLGDLSRLHPEIEVTVLLGTAYVDLAHRAADVAVRTTFEPPPDLVGRRVGSAGVGIYGSAAYLDGRATDDLTALDWVGWEASSSMFFAKWTVENIPSERVRLRVSAAWGLREAIDAGIGVAILPTALGESRPGWRRVRVFPEMAAPLWILTHRDLRNTTRVRQVRDYLVAAIAERSAAFEGPPAA
ncbi:MAG: LysR family transcriptional regulator [Alphaproteobacteria bacterium]|nr:LysR family transcriptional regulator [Alphaproteobacteria bacterium]